MKLSLVVQDATSIEADLQFVKHFDGRIGGSEAAINRKLRGALAPVFDELERSNPPSGRIVRTDIDKVRSRPDVDKVRSRRLLVLGLGPLDDFGTEDLSRAIDYATRSALTHGFAIIATPVIGVSQHVGLPVDRAYRILLSAFFRTVVARDMEDKGCPIDELRVFDLSDRKVELMAQMTEDILTELGLDFRAYDARRFEIQVGTRTGDAARDEVSSPITVDPEPIIPGTARVETPPPTTRLLFLAANPRDTEPLRLDEEVREIDTAIRQADYRSSFDVRQHGAVRVMDLQSLMLRHRPHIVHFSGHGESSANAIMLEDVLGKYVIVEPTALTRMFAVFRTHLRCVVLNSCYSAGQAEAIAEVIDCVVGMSSAIGDQSAIGFAKAFYQALAYGRSVQEAFELGSVQIGLEGLPDEKVPKLLSRSGVVASSVRFVANV